MEKLGIQPILIIAQIVNFVILLLLLKKFLFKPILKVLDERKKKAEETEELNNEAGKKFLEATESEKNTISEAKKQADKIITQSKELEIVRKKLESEIEADKKEMFKEIKRQSAEMAVLIAEKVMQESFDENKQKSLLNQAIKDLEKVSLH